MVIYSRRTFGWSGSPSFWGVMSAGAGHAHWNTTVASGRILREGTDMMAHVTVVDRWEEVNPTTVLADAKKSSESWGGGVGPLLRCRIRGRLLAN